MYRRALTAIFILIIVFSGGCISGEEKYVLEDTSNYILLKEDGTYFCYQKNAPCFEGKYERTEGEVFLFVPLGSFRLQDEGSRLIDHEGDSWIKQ